PPDRQAGALRGEHRRVSAWQGGERPARGRGQRAGEGRGRRDGRPRGRHRGGDPAASARGASRVPGLRGPVRAGAAQGGPGRLPDAGPADVLHRRRAGVPRLDVPPGCPGARGGRGHSLGLRERLHQGRGLQLERPDPPGERVRGPGEGAPAHRGQGVRRPRRRLHALPLQRVTSPMARCGPLARAASRADARQDDQTFRGSATPSTPPGVEHRSRSPRRRLGRTVPRPVASPDTAWVRSAFASLVGQIGPETDQLILRARASGERWVAAVRLVLVAGVSVLALAVSPGQRWTGLTLLLAAGLLQALLLAWLAFRVDEPWLPWLSCAADVALTSAALLFILRHGGTSAAMHTRSFYELYFLVIMSAGLRYDWRLCIWTAGLCIVAHAFLLWVAAGPLGLEIPGGGVGRASQGVHFAMLALGGIIMAAVAQRAKRLRLMVGVDHLTGLSQRAPFVERIAEELARARRRGSSLSVAILDLDGFKVFNDTFGHPVGDRALQAVATRLRSSVRKSDLVARFGGEEFVVAF